MPFFGAGLLSWVLIQYVTEWAIGVPAMLCVWAMAINSWRLNKALYLTATNASLWRKAAAVWEYANNLNSQHAEYWRGQVELVPPPRLKN